MTNEAAAAQVLAEYYSTFSTLDLKAILPYFYEPATIIGPPGVFSFPDRAALSAVFERTIEELRSKGYARSEFSLEDLRMLGDSAAAATGVAIRFKHDGQELERVQITYVLHKNESGWKIAVMVFHGAPATRG